MKNYNSLSASGLCVEEIKIRRVTSLLLIVVLFFSSSLLAGDGHFPLLRSRAARLQIHNVDKKERAQLKEELAIERALWEDEVKKETAALKASRSAGAGEAMSRLTQIDGEVQARFNALAADLEKTTPIRSNVLDAVVAPETKAVPDWPIRSGSGANLVPSHARKTGGFRKLHVESAPLAGYNQAPSTARRSQERAASESNAPQAEEPIAPIADLIAAKAAELNHDPIALYRFVLNEIRAEHYFGSMKSAEVVLRSGSGNDADQSALLMELFRASDYHARLVWGVEELPVDALYNHFGVDTSAVLERLLTRAGIPWEPVVQGGRPVAYRLERVWCEAWLPFANFRGVILDQSGFTWAPLDPEWKSMQPRITRRILTEMGLNAETFLSNYLSGSLCSGDPQTAAGCAPARDVLASQVDSYLATQNATDTYASLSASRLIEAQNEAVLPSTLPGKIVSINGVYLTLPDSLQHRLRIQATTGATTVLDSTVNVADLSGREAVLWFAPATDTDQAVADAYGGDVWSAPPYLINVTPQLLARGAEVAKGTAGIGMGQTFDLSYTLLAPSGDETSFTNKAMAGVPVAIGIGAGKQAYAMAGAEPANTPEILSKLANDYLDSKSGFEQELAAISGLTVFHRFPSVVSLSTEVEAVQDLGLVRSLNFKGATVDADVWGASAEGGDAAIAKTWTTLTSLNASILERRIFEAYGVASVSADKAILLSRLQSIPIIHIDQSNVAAQLASLPYSAAIKGEIQSWVNAGGVADIPQSPLTYVLWTGVGYILTDPATGEAKYQLAGGLSGGMTVTPDGDVLDAISQLLNSINKEQVNLNPQDAVRLVTPGWVFGIPIQTVDTVISVPLTIVALDAQGRRVVGREITLHIDGDGAGFVDVSGHMYPGSVTLATNAAGEVPVSVHVAKFTGWKSDVEPEYLTLDPDDTYDTLLGLYGITVESGDLKFDQPLWVLTRPDAPKELSVSVYPSALPALTVLQPTESDVKDQFGNPVANVTLHHSWTDWPDGQVLPGFLTREYIADYVLDHPWPTTNEVFDGVQDALDVLTDSSGTAYAYPALGDGVTPGTTALSNFTLTAGSLSQNVQVRILGIPTFTVQVEPRATLYGEPIEAYAPQENVQGDASVTVRQVSVFAYDTTAEVDYYHFAQVTFSFPNFPGVPDMFLNGTQQDSYTVPYPPLPATPGMYGYHAQVQIPAQPVNVFSVPVWAIRPSVLGDKSFFVPKGGSNCAPKLVKATVEPAEYLNRSNQVLAQTLGGYFSMEVPDPVDLNGVHTFPLAIFNSQDPAKTILGGNIDPGLLTSNESSATVKIKMNRPWATISHETLQASRKFDVDGISIAIEPDLPSACVLTGDASPFAVVVKAEGSAKIDSSDWTATLTVHDAANPQSEVIPISLSPSGEDLRGTIDEVNAAKIVAMSDPVFSAQAHLIPDQCSLPVQDLHLYHLEQPPVHITTTRVYLRNVHRTCAAHPDEENPHVGTFTLPGLPEGETWIVSVDGTPVNDPTGQPGWQPGTYPAPYPNGLASGSFLIQATASCSGGPVTLEWHADIQNKTTTEGGLPLSHPMFEGVDLATGGYHLTRQDLTRPGLAGGLSLLRSFSNIGGFYEQGLGNGWDFNYELTLSYRSDCQVYIASDIEGTPYEFDASVNPPIPFPGYHGTLTQSDGGYLLTTKNGTRYFFTPAPGKPNLYLLQRIVDPFGNTISVQWLQLQTSTALLDRVHVVTDPAGRSLTFDYSDNSITTVTGSDGEKFVYVKDEQGALISAKRYQVSGTAETLLWSESYTYKPYGQADFSNLDTFTDRDGHVTKVTYVTAVTQGPDYQPPPPGSTSTVASSPSYSHVQELEEGVNPDTKDHPEQVTRFAYDLSTLDEGTEATMTTIVTNGKGQTTTYTIGEEGESRAVTIDALQQTTSTDWDLAKIVKTKETDPLGKVTTYLYNSDGDQTDVTIDTHLMSYPLTDGDGNPITGISTHRDYDPLWHKVTFERTPDGQETTYTVDGNTGAIKDKIETGKNQTHQDVTRQEVFGYDLSNGNLLSDKNFESETTTYSNHDNLGNARHIDFPKSGVFVDRTFDTRGRKTSETSSQGRSETWDYNDLDQLAVHTVTDTRKATDFLRETWNYSTEGLLQEHSDNAGLLETYGYDRMGRKISQSIQTGQLLPNRQREQYDTTWIYDPAGLIDTRTDPDGSIHTFDYDEAGRVLAEHIDSKLLYSQHLDAAGNVIDRTDHRNAKTLYHYDALYRKIQEIAPQVRCANSDGTVALCNPDKKWLYDQAGRTTKETDGNQNDRVFKYDGFKRVAEEDQPLGHIITRTYDRMDRLMTEEHQPEALRIEKDYDDLGRVTSERRKLLLQNKTYETTYVYDDTAQTVLVTDPEHEVQLVTNDGLGHVKSVALDPSGMNLVHSVLYDRHGKQRLMTDANSNTTTWVNDGLGRSVLEISPLLQTEDTKGGTGQKAATTKRQYDFAGRVVLETDPLLAQVIHTYDPLGRELTRTFSFNNNSESLRIWIYHDGALLATPDRSNPVDPSVSETDGRGNPINHWYDAMGREVMAQDQENHITQFEFDKNSNLVNKINRRGFVQRAGYDALNRKTETRWPGGADGLGNDDFVESTLYDDATRTVSTVDRMGYYHIRTNDEAGRKVEERTEEHNQSGGILHTITNGHWTYDGLDRTVDEFDGNNNQTRLSYDAVGRVDGKTTAVGTPESYAITYVYDNMDHITEVDDCEGRIIHKTYDNGYRLLSEQDKAGHTTSYGSDLAGRRVSTTDGENERTTNGYDPRGRLISVRDAENNLTQYGYDGNNNRTFMLNGENHRTEWEYDGVNRVTKEKRLQSNAPAQETQMSYDEEGDRTGMIDPAQQHFTYEFDALGRETMALYPSTVSSPDQTIKRIVHDYDDLDRETQVRQIRKLGSGETTETRSLTWDFAGRQTTETDGHGVAQTYTYYDNGNRQSSQIDVPQQISRTIGYAYDGRNRLQTVTDAGTTTYHYLCRGEKLDTVDRADGSTETFGYDQADRLTSKTVKDASQQVLLSYGYGYDKADRRTSQTEDHGQGLENTAYQYYDNGELWTVDYPDGKHVEYTYDHAGNRKTEITTAGGPSVSSKTYSYNELEQLTGISDSIVTTDSTGFIYDANGNQTSKTEHIGATTKLTESDYNSRNELQLVRVDHAPQAQFAYDDAGRRIQKNNEFEHWDGSSLIAETDGVSGALLRDYTHGLDLLHETIGSESVTTYTDALGSIGMLHAATGTAHYRYDAFGTFRNAADCVATPNQLACKNKLTFTGHLFDSESALYYFNARYYDSSIGQFTTTDPAVDLSKYHDFFASGFAGTTYVGKQALPSMVVGQHAVDTSVVKTESGFEPAFSSMTFTPDPVANSVSANGGAANSAAWNASTGKDDLAPQLSLELRPQYVSTDTNSYPAADPTNPGTWYSYAYALNSPANYTDPMGLCVGVGCFYELLEREQETAAVAEKGAKTAGNFVKNDLLHVEHYKEAYSTLKDPRATTREKVMAASVVVIATADIASNALTAGEEGTAVKGATEVVEKEVVAREVESGTKAVAEEIARVAPEHHLFTNKNYIRGEQWSKRFEPLFERAGTTLKDIRNRVGVLGHAGPHPDEYHQIVYDRMVQATRGLEGSKYAEEFFKELAAIRKEASTPGSALNKLLTK